MASDRPVRVVQMIDRLDWDPGGAERLAVALTTNLPPERIDVTLYTTRAQEGPLLDQVRASGVRHFGLDRETRLDVLAWRRLGRYLRDSGTEVLHTHKYGSNFWGAIIGRLAGVPAIVAHE